MKEDKWEVIKFKFEQTLKSWEIDKKCGQITPDSIYSLFPTEIEAIIDYVNNLQSQLKAKEEVIKEAREYVEKCKHLNWYVESCYTNDLLEILSKGENKWN
mgnify:FL=1